ncbi:DKNYY domain-containing protein [Pseudomonas alvandae]|uniref:DKNYY domain-containing protein n=1 Tax=Pseudomonas canavaninivorans TaxID=2842348 RepID=UPI00215E72D5|nr:DKNYY domain-containing protein [Pseudomonas canavaninivorans]UVM70669.1 DKNYY domain-containing protein [Pseudomonas canavaninivorans]
MTDTETVCADWEPLDLEWHQGFAFMDDVLLGDGRVPDVYILLSPEGARPGELAQRAGDGGYPPSPLMAGQPVWRHRRNPWILRDALHDYYLLPGYRERHGYHALQALPFQFHRSLESLGHQYWRDETGAYWFGEYAITEIRQARPDSLALLPSSPVSVASTSALFSDGASIFLHGKFIAAATARVRYCNHPSYRVIDGQVYKGFKPLHQKDGTPLPIANPDDFHMLAQRWGTDGQSIIVQAQHGSSISYEYFYRIDNADLATFTVLNERYAKDNRRAYYLTGKTIRYVGDFRLLKCSQPTFDECGRVVSASEYEDDYFAVDDKFVYAAGTRLRDAHGPSFRHLGFDYYRDRQYVYQRQKRLDVDVESFVVAQLYRNDQDYAPVLAGDKNGPLGSGGIIDAAMQQAWAPYFEAHPQLKDYWWHRLQAKAGAAQIFSETAPLRAIGLGFDVGRQVHFHGRAINGLDAASFKLLDTHLCGDAHGLYLIPFHNAETQVPERFSMEPAEHFRSLGSPYLTDGKTVYCHRVFYHPPEPIRKAHAPSFESCGHGWAKDREAVYYYGEAKKRLHPAETRVLGTYAISPALIFSEGKWLDVDFAPDEVRVPHPDFLQLGTRKLFCHRRPLSAKRFDLATLEFLTERYARDRHRFYYYDGYGTLTEVEEADYWASLGQPVAGA